MDITTEKKRRLRVLQAAAELVRKAADKPFSVLTDQQELLGFRIGWFKDADPLLIAAGYKPDQCELILMQADTMTDCHLHMKGATTFLFLGEEHGFKNPNGGTLMTNFQHGQEEFELIDHPAVAGQSLLVSAQVIHAFHAQETAGLTAIGLVHSKIRKGPGEFDVVDFNFIDESCRRVRLDKDDPRAQQLGVPLTSIHSIMCM
ncbi:MAG: hypothetical protein WCV73_02250 [Patescibacteria group bacterium]|jgi:hypothetical protein